MARRLLFPSDVRAIWKGRLSFGLVTIPVEVYSAVESSEQVHFCLSHRKDLAPIEFRKYCSREEVEVDNDEIVRGLESPKHEFKMVEEEEIEEIEKAIAPEQHVIEVEEFVDFASIDPLSIDRPYYVAPGKGGKSAYAVLRDALRQSERAGIVRLALHGRPRLAALVPEEQALALATLRPFEQLRDPSGLPLPPVKMKSRELELAKTLIESMSAEWKPQTHPDRYKRAIEKLLSKKPRASGRGRKTTSRPDSVVDLREALKKSVRREGGRKRKTASARKAGAA
jgi:DNA end-binding protein Ku